MTMQLTEDRLLDYAAAQTIDTTYLCPECGEPTTVEWKDTAASTAGPVEHVKIRCGNRHWFLMLSERLSVSVSRG